MLKLPVHPEHTPGRGTRRPCAFTLIEALIASSIIAVATVALVSPFSLAARHQRLAADRTVGLSLATQMVERLLRLDYTQIVALDGKTEVGAQITDASGQPMNDPALAGYTRTVQTTELALPLIGQSSDEAAVFCRATVTVTHAGMAPIVVTRLFAQE